MATLSPTSVTAFQSMVYRYYGLHQRVFPWRETTDPYAILISEYMLQQTQTDRVRPKYEQWLEYFPTPAAVAQAPLQEVLGLWQGLGYNRRARNLQRAMQAIIEQHDGVIPRSVEELQALPGIGPYTAAAVVAFAYGQPTIVLETNIRSVYLYYFVSPEKNKVSDRELIPWVEQTLDQTDPRSWYYALMDYGVMIKKTVGNAARRSQQYTRQSRFAGSNRQKRGEILRQLTSHGQVDLGDYPAWQEAEWQKPLRQLMAEGLVVQEGQKLRIT